MRTYREYYELAKEKRLKWYRNQKDEWWKTNNRDKELTLLGDYLETVNIISVDTKNDCSVMSNHTNVKNSEWSILFDMLGQALIDWCIENNETSMYAYSISIDRNYVQNEDTFTLSHRLKVIDNDNCCWKKVDESHQSFKRFNECDEFLCDIIAEFIYDHKYDIPLEWNHFGFGLDSLDTSCQYNEWSIDSDGSMSLGYYTKNDYITLVSCL